MKLSDFQRHGQNLVFTEPGRLSPAGYRDGSETYLLQLLQAAQDLSVGSPELQRGMRDWASQYHLSPYRSTIFDCFRFLNSKASVLELGCGCGAITRWLGEHFSHVDAVEGNYNRAEVAKTRCRDLDHVNVYTGNYSQIEFERRYHIATLIGVLEYGHLYLPQHRHSPHQAGVFNLKQARSALVDGGVLVLAIENRLGLKYWSGCREDHNGKMFDSLHGYPECNSAVTFGATELRKMLREAGFPRSDFFLPWPDYKLARTIVSSQLANPNYYLHNWIRTPFPDRHPGQRSVLWNESLTLRELFNDGQFEALSNSFLILAWTDQEATAQALGEVDTQWVAKYYALERKRALQKEVALRPNALQGAIVEQSLLYEFDKGPGTGSGMSHCLPNESFFRGDLLLYQIFEIALKKDAVNEFEQWFCRYLDFVTTNFDTGHRGPQGQVVVRSEAIDAMPWNIIVDPDTHEWRVFDLEWSMDGTVSLADVVYRFLINLHARHAPYVTPLIGDDRDGSIKQWMSRVVPGYTESDIAVVRQRDRQFIQYVVVDRDQNASLETFNTHQLDATFKKAKAAIDAGRHDEAETLLEDLALANRTYHPAWHQLGVLAYVAGKVDRAAHCVQAAVALVPGNVEYLSDLAVIRVAQEKPEEALVLVKKALALAPTYGPALETLAALE